MKYLVTAAGRTIEAELDGEQITVDGRTMRVAVEAVAGSEQHVLRVDDAVYVLDVRRGEGATRGKYELGIDGFRIAVEALDERAKAIRELSRAQEGPRGPAQLTAPMPGLVVRVNVNEGDRVHAAQGLVVMEAMKMENELKATASGIVRRVLVSPGSAVEKGAVLLELEPSE